MSPRALGWMLVAVLGCSREHGNDGHTAPAAGGSVTQPAVPTVHAMPALAGAEDIPFGSPRSSIDFVGYKRTLSHDGSFASFTGTIQLVPDHVEQSRVNVRIQTSSLITPIAKLTADLRSPGFLGVDLFPEATFVSTAITPVPGGGGNDLVTGILTLHGVSHAIQFPAEITVTPADVTVHARFTLSRGVFSVGHPPATPTGAAPRPDAIRDDVTLRIVIRASRPHAATAPH